jgi:predicted nucleic acid-binding protein
VTAFLDTSALYAILDANDEHHKTAKQTWIELVDQQADLIITNYIAVETFAIVQRRLGIAAIRTLQEAVLPVLRVQWVAEVGHQAGVMALLVAANRQLSLVDCVSFETMRTLGIKTAFAFDRHFSEQGFECIPTDW